MSQIVSENLVVAKGDFPAICEASFNIISDGAFFAPVTSPNGSGKTTLLKSISGSSQIARGKLKVDGIDVNKDLLKLKKTATYIGHSFNYLDHFKVIEHLELNAKLDKMSQDKDQEKSDFKILDVAQALEFCQLSNRKDVFINDLSAGQKRRLHIACAFMRNVDIVLIDEPHASLDSKSKDAFDELFTQQFEEGRSLLIATHDPGRLNKVATDFLHIENGVVTHSEGEMK